ncbi:MAG TPA: expansin C-terminal domain-related protein [Candidatus Thermoplasmatota archaeon]|nr:expansin C-terminal domain-related protein [Candidatus Thermoplasmatota archaeon]
MDVRSSRTISKVEVKVGTGSWTNLARTDWGSWARSSHAPQGSVLQFRATASDGATTTSSCYQWTSGSPTTCPSGTSPPPTYTATFSNPRGNMWWVEVDVGSSKSLAGVDMRVSGGSWSAMQKTDWGSWARSTHVPDGSEVEFRARATDGSVATSQKFLWPPK